MPGRLPLEPGARYVALGSSFAAGSGIAPMSGGLCLRSDHDYPHRVAAALDLELIDVTCSGATVANVRDTPQNGAAAQSDAVTADTALISLTVGGNDLGYTTLAGECGNPAAAPCVVDASTLEPKVAQLRADLTALIEELQARAPSAVVVLVTYPVVANPPDCAALGFAPDEAALVASVGESLQDVLVDVAARTGVLLVDPYAASDGHGPCAPDGERWVEGLVAKGTFPYHPTAAGHAAMAQLVLDALATAAPPQRAAP
ncbi:SGNH/GDSL hydrolase family protein [Candidatus Binatia bacterium]|nr:SGNH/GDSL hydrolase family protein [Candidatus Binatia bacterium]